MNRLVLLCLILVGLVILVYAARSSEAFTDVLPDDVIQAGQERFNKLMDLVSLPNPQLPFTPQTVTAIDQATNSPQFEGGLPGAYRMVGASNPYKLPPSPPTSLQTAQTVCEPINTADCTAFQDPTFAANCGISFDIKGKDSKGQPHIGGLYISPDDRTYQQQQNTQRAPDDLRYTPTFGTAGKGQFAIDASSCRILSEKLQCTKTHDLTSTNCAQCFTSSDFHRIDPSTPRMPPSFVVQTNATAMTYLDPTGTPIVLQVQPDTPMPINPTTAVTEGSAFQFQLTGPSDGSLYFAGYLTSQTSKGAFNLDLNALIATDAVTNYKPRLNGTTVVNNTTCLNMCPGMGLPNMKLLGTMPFTFLSPYEFDARNCDNGPFVTLPSSATFLNSDVCYAPSNKPGAYSLSCLQQLFVSFGGTTRGTGYPSNAQVATQLNQTSTGTPRSLTDIGAYLGTVATQAATGMNNGQELTLADWNAASLFMTGTPITSPCDTSNKDKGPLTAECLQFLYSGAGNGTVPPTYTLGTSYASQDACGNAVYCTADGALSPSNPAGLKRAQAAGGITAVQTLYNAAFTTANDNTLRNEQRKGALTDCYGVALQNQAPEVFWVGALPTAYNITSAAQAQSVCAQVGAQVATVAQLNTAWINGAQWCTIGSVADSTSTYYPMNSTAPVEGCGAAMALNNAGSRPTAGANCYGVKPDPSAVPASLQVLPFSTPYLPVYNPAAAVYNDPGAV